MLIPKGVFQCVVLVCKRGEVSINERHGNREKEVYKRDSLLKMYLPLVSVT